VNQKELQKLSGSLYVFKGEIEGDFNDKLLPNDLELELKEGAQIMFIKNDSSPDKKYFNGKLATISKIEGQTIKVLFENDPAPYELKKETWKNIRYQLNESTNQIDEDELGSYTQFPVRLAWAVTIHKSQGLSFEKAIIDAGQSFAAGQVYVALSRCTNMEGLVLHSFIPRTAIYTDERIIAFARQEAKADELQRVLEQEKEAFMANQLLMQFNFAKLLLPLENFVALVPSKKLPNQAAALTVSKAVFAKANELFVIGGKFITELKGLLANSLADRDNLLTRTQKAIDYFTTQLVDHILTPLQQHQTDLNKAVKVKQYLSELKKTELEVWAFIVKLNNSVYDDFHFNKNRGALEKYNPVKQKAASVPKQDGVVSSKLSTDMFLEGRSIEQIALERNLAISTVEGHLAQQVRKGQLDIFKLLEKEKVDLIAAAIDKIGGNSIAPIKEVLDPEITYNQVRAVLNYKSWLSEKVSYL
jgi:hypothetical protein